MVATPAARTCERYVQNMTGRGGTTHYDLKAASDQELVFAHFITQTALAGSALRVSDIKLRAKVRSTATYIG